MNAYHAALTVNGEPRAADIDPRTSLLDLLRERLGLTGAKKGCDHGQCGACAVLLNGRRVNACLVLAVAHDGAEATTIEGLEGGDLHPVQQPPGGATPRTPRDRADEEPWLWALQQPPGGRPPVPPGQGR